MDETSQKLLQKLSRVGNQPSDAQSNQRPASHKLMPGQEDGNHDRWRILLVDLVYLISIIGEMKEP